MLTLTLHSEYFVSRRSPVAVDSASCITRGKWAREAFSKNSGLLYCFINDFLVLKMLLEDDIDQPFSPMFPKLFCSRKCC